MQPVLYLYRSCTSCRNAAAALDAQGIDYAAREYFKEPFTREELQGVLDRAGMTAAELVATRSRPYRAERMGEQQLSDDDLIDRMLSEPRLVRRPILVTDDDVVVGYNADRYATIAQTLAAAQRAGR